MTIFAKNNLRMALKKILLAQFSNITIERMMDRYTELITTPIEKVVDAGCVSCYSNDEFVMPTFEIKIKPKPRRAILYHKFLFISHLIITKCSESKDNKIQLHSKRVQNVLGEDYPYLIYTLCDLGLVDITSGFEIGKHCRFISLKDWNIKFEEVVNFKCAEYLNKWNTLTDKDIAKYQTVDFEIKVVEVEGQLQVIKEETPSISEYDKWFYDCYNNALSYLCLRTDVDTAQRYVDSLFTNRNTHKYHHSLYKILNFNKDNNKIYSIDKQNRIYNYLTNLKKELKPLFNIKYQLDIANSHPLLLCRLLICKYKLNKEILDIIYNKEKDNNINTLHNILEQLCNELKNNNINIASDIVRFIYACSNGMIWDELQTAFPSLTRDEIKNHAFAQIFYNERNIARYTEFGKRFIEVYPNVYSVIAEVKEVVNLPIKMMEFESAMIRKVLDRCYRMGWNVVSIHDAIVILDTPNNALASSQEIINIINDVYAEMLLRPTIHYDELNLNI